MCYEIDLFTGEKRAIAIVATAGGREADVAKSLRADAPHVMNPCTNCYLREVCDSDYCGRRLQ